MELLGELARQVREHWSAVGRDARDATEWGGHSTWIGAWVPESPVGEAPAATAILDEHSPSPAATAR